MTGFIERHIVGLLSWMVGISWVFHVNLMAAASFRGDTVARNWELIILMCHHAFMLGLFLHCYRRRQRDGSL